MYQLYNSYISARNVYQLYNSYISARNVYQLYNSYICRWTSPLPTDCANAIVWLAGDQSAKTTGHVIPVDGGLPEAFLR